MFSSNYCRASMKSVFFLFPLLLILLFTLINTSSHYAHASSHDDGFPPFPYLVIGTVEVNGAFLPNASGLTAKVGDWETRPVDVTDGSFGTAPGIPIVIGPPNDSYVGKTVTFHLPDGLIADQSFLFESLPEPAFTEQNLTFSSSDNSSSPAKEIPAVTSEASADNGSSGSAQNINDNPGLDMASGTGTFMWVIVAILGIAFVFLIYWFRIKKEKQYRP